MTLKKSVKKNTHPHLKDIPKTSIHKTKTLQVLPIVIIMIIMREDLTKREDIVPSTLVQGQLPTTKVERNRIRNPKCLNIIKREEIVVRMMMMIMIQEKIRNLRERIGLLHLIRAHLCQGLKKGRNEKTIN